MKRVTFTIITLLVFGMTLSLPAFSQQSHFNSNLTDANLAVISSHKVLIRNVDSLKHLGLESTNADFQRVIDTAKKLKPSYITEIIQVRPYKGNEDLLERLQPIILDIPSYAGIPYYSEHAQKWFELYSSAKVLSQTTEGDTQKLVADLAMEPFGVINTSIVIRSSKDSLYYESTNNNNLRYYDKFTCVNSKKMKSLITVYRDGDNWILYGIGGVNAPDVFFLRERIEVSFLNRIKTFCAFIFEKL